MKTEQGTRHFYIRSAEPFWERDKDGNDVALRVARHPIAVVVAADGIAPFEPLDKVFEDLPDRDQYKQGDPVDVILFAVATLNQSASDDRGHGDVFDRQYGYDMALRRLDEPKWHPERGQARVAQSFVLPCDKPRDAILRAIIDRREHWHPGTVANPTDHKYMFPTNTRRWARDMLHNPKPQKKRKLDDTVPSHVGE